MIQEIWKRDSVVAHAALIAKSYEFWTKQTLFDKSLVGVDLAKAMYHAPFVVVSHGTEADPIFNYGNLTAQKLWEITWDEITVMPSRLSAEPMEQSRRNLLLEEGKQRGITVLEKGLRVRKNGQRFYIKDVKLFNLIEDGQYLGQGAVYMDWEFV